MVCVEYSKVETKSKIYLVSLALFKEGLSWSDTHVSHSIGRYIRCRGELIIPSYDDIYRKIILQIQLALISHLPGCFLIANFPQTSLIGM